MINKAYIWYKYGQDPEHPTVQIMYKRECIGSIRWGLGHSLSGGYPLGYSIDEKFRGHGIMAGAVKALVAWSSLQTFQACVEKDNHASIRTLINAGFVQVGFCDFVGRLYFEYKKIDHKVLTRYSDKVA